MGMMELIVGSMYAGKTGELIRRIKREHIAHKKVVLFKPKIDSRYKKDAISSHDDMHIEAHVVETAAQMRSILAQHSPVDVIGIDELQFFDEGIIDFCADIVHASSDTKIIASGLSRDFRGEPFTFPNSKKNIGEIMPYARSIVVLKAICTQTDQGKTCGLDAEYPQRLIEGKPAQFSDPIILVGAKDSYEARCRQHHKVPGHPRRNIE